MNGKGRRARRDGVTACDATAAGKGAGAPGGWTSIPLPLELGEDAGRPAAVENVAAAGQLARRDEGELRERMRRAEEEQRRQAERRREIQRANLQPDQAPVRHGVHARPGAYMLCDRCPIREQCEEYEPGERCGPEQEYVERRTRELYAVEWIEPQLDGPTVKFLVWLEVRMERAARYIGMRGEIEGGAYLPVAKDVQGLHNSWLRTLEKLGLTPERRKAMSETGQAGFGDLAAALLGIARERAGEPEGGGAEVVEAEFTVTGETGDGLNDEDAPRTPRHEEGAGLGDDAEPATEPEGGWGDEGPADNEDPLRDTRLGDRDGL
jgi:hypothetical protein